jgi:hypothetical protein
MQKLIFTNIIFLVLLCNAYTQTASDYFPANTGYKWYYKNVPLDSNSNPQTGLATYEIDSFAVVHNYYGLNADIVLGKKGLLTLNQNTPYTDSSFYNFQSSNAYVYFSVSLIPDSLLIGGIGNFFNSLQAWYNTYRFAQTVNSSYTIFSKDTTVNINGTNVPLRLSYKGKRLNDETISTVNGNYSTKKFVMTLGVSYILTIFEIPIFAQPDTIWYAQGVWKVKESIPSVSIDLSQIGLNYSFYVPGSLITLVQPDAIREISSQVPAGFDLHQNFPNPFNPETKIRFELPKATNINLKVYDINGKEVCRLASGRFSAGTYETTFDGTKFSSGTYIYRLEAEAYTISKSMILLK